MARANEALWQVYKGYPKEARRALDAQLKDWSERKPLAGVSVLDATPLFRNTLLKHLVLLEGGAELRVAYGDGIPYDRAVVEALEAYGLKSPTQAEVSAGFDVVLDCAGAHAQVPARYGYVELTRSGVYVYEGRHVPVYLADGGKVKALETSLGTGDGLVRGLKALGFDALRGKSVGVVGCGKVGSGILFRLLQEGAQCVVLDLPGVPPPFGVPLVSVKDREAVERTLASLEFLITATGHRHAFAGVCDREHVLREGLTLVNMGIEDEFGPEVPNDRVLNGNAPLNFILDEPTELRYIDPTMALHNAGILKLLEGLPPGIHLPSDADEMPLLEALEPALREELERFLTLREEV